MTDEEKNNFLKRNELINEKICNKLNNVRYVFQCYDFDYTNFEWFIGIDVLNDILGDCHYFDKEIIKELNHSDSDLALYGIKAHIDTKNRSRLDLYVNSDYLEKIVPNVWKGGK